MKISIRKAVKSDMSRVRELIVELAVFEKEPNAVNVSVNDLETYGFGDHPKFTCFVAETAEGIYGIALVYERFSTWEGPVLHLEDLIVQDSKRGHGIGTALLDRVVTFGSELGVNRISWEVLDWNEPAIKFYESKGALVRRDWDVVQLDGKGIKDYIAKL